MSQVFDRLLETFYRSWFRFHPDLAVRTGIQGYGDRLPPVEDSDIGALISLEQKMLSSLDELDAASLDPDRRLDRELLGATLSLALYGQSRLDWRYRDPLRFVPLEAVHQLLVRPVEHFRECLLSRLEQIPEYLRAARSFLLADPAAVPGFWVELAIDQAEAGAAFLRSLPEQSKVRQQLARPEHLRRPIEAAVRALGEYRHFLARDLQGRAQGSPACGSDYFGRLLRQHHFLDLDAGELLAIGVALEHKAREALGAGAAPVGSATASLATWRFELEQSREHVRQLGIVSVPAGESPRVEEMPSILWPLSPSPDYLSPVPGDAAQEGIIYVAPETPGADETAAILGSWRLGWPGRHLQALRANARRAATSLPRRLAASSLSVLGWGDYCEGLMLQSGQVSEAGPADLHAAHRLIAALRLRLDVELHTRGLSVAGAIRRLIEEVGMSSERARAEVAWISRAPTVALGEALGGELLRALRELQLGQGATLLGFHDRLLEDGPIPLPLLVRRLAGDQGWRELRAAVCELE
jgi:uncharacterized protein (DUF885 family)